jgi:hypothetical protein
MRSRSSLGSVAVCVVLTVLTILCLSEPLQAATTADDGMSLCWLTCDREGACTAANWTATPPLALPVAVHTLMTPDVPVQSVAAIRTPVLADWHVIPLVPRSPPVTF